eukprot:8122577-Alexandrium_andersonii.AAC.1
MSARASMSPTVESETETAFSDDGGPEPEAVKPPCCLSCRKPMMPRTKDSDRFWGCQDFPRCEGRT